MGKISSYGNASNPSLGDKLIGTSVGSVPVNGTFNFTLQQLWNLFQPLVPIPNLQLVLDSGNTATKNINLTGTINATTLNVGNITSTGILTSANAVINGYLKDKNNSVGTAGQLLSSTVTGTQWISVSSFDTNIYNSDGTLTGDRTVTMDGYTLSFDEDIFVNGLTIGKGGGNYPTNVALGNAALYSNVGGSGNTALGHTALYSNTGGLNNTAVGNASLLLNTTGAYNTSIGTSALVSNTIGSWNVALGSSAGYYIANKTTPATILGSSIMIGYRTSPLGNNQTNQIVIGYDAIGNGSNTVQIGNNSIINVKTFGTITANNITYPNVDGTSGQVLTTDGLGNATWQSAGGVGTNIYNSNGTLTGNRIVTMGNYTLSFSKDIFVGGDTKIGVGNPLLTNLILGSYSLNSVTTGSGNIGIGSYSLYDNTTGSRNISIGTNSLSYNITGSNNTAVGYFAMQYNTTGSSNTALGRNSLSSNTSGVSNVAIGDNSLTSNTTGGYSVSVGHQALFRNTTASSNIAVGFQSVFSTVTGSGNTGIGFQALYSNTSGAENIAIGTSALYSNIIGNNNLAIGNNSLNTNTSNDNTAIGYNSLLQNATGSNNVSVGSSSMLFSTTGAYNTAVGAGSMQTNTTGQYNVTIGYSADVLNGANNNSIVIGYNAVGIGSNTVVLGNTSIVKTILRGTINAANLPTSSAGLVSGDLWKNGTVINIV